MRALLKGTGYLLYLGSGIIMFFAYISFLGQWLGFLGYIIGVIIAPGLILFPLIVWLKTGVFPYGYFGIWALGVFGGTFFFWLGSIGEN